jgi:drug/metabolite transporter (DMT)-like permease
MVAPMQLFLLTSLTMIAFAANSVLNRMALVDGGMDAMLFGALRLGSGGLALAVLVIAQRKGFGLGGWRRVLGVGALLLYIFGFSLAYGALDAGLGALILFGMVQITMFSWAVFGGERPGVLRWVGASAAFGGLVWLLWPDGQLSLPLWHVVSMVLAGFGWGAYSLVGRGEDDPLQATAMNFLLAAPIAVALAFITLSGSGPAPSIQPLGFGLAVLSGVVTSGMGYALWYRILPALGATRAAVAQLTVPVIALCGGVLLLGEGASLRFILAAALVLGGVLLSLIPTQVKSPKND